MKYLIFFVLIVLISCKKQNPAPSPATQPTTPNTQPVDTFKRVVNVYSYTMSAPYKVYSTIKVKDSESASWDSSYYSGEKQNWTASMVTKMRYIHFSFNGIAQYPINTSGLFSFTLTVNGKVVRQCKDTIYAKSGIIDLYKK